MGKGTGRSRGKGKAKAKDEPKTNKEKHEAPKETKDAEVKEQTRPKFRFECQQCGQCCDSETILVSIPDLERWMSDNTIYRLMHILKLEEIDGKQRIILIKDEDGKCNLYHRDNKSCTIYETRPLFCRAYPLGYNGTDYFVRMKDCKGLNKGEMTKDKLKMIREDAFTEYIATRQFDNVFPIIYGIIFNKLIDDSKAFMEKMADSEKAEENEAQKTDETSKTKEDPKQTK
jgi:Fe-S-cluster containining protein